MYPVPIDLSIEYAKLNKLSLKRFTVEFFRNKAVENLINSIKKSLYKHELSNDIEPLKEIIEDFNNCESFYDIKETIKILKETIKILKECCNFYRIKLILQ